jgi:hypothetical protein
MSSPVTLYAHAAPAHEHALFAAPRPLPGRQVGRVAGMVFDVDPAYEEEARRLDGQPITLITEAGLERLAVRLLAEDGGRYTRADYEGAGVWNPEEIARLRGHAVITIESIDGIPLIDATEADDRAAGLAAPMSPRYVTVTVVVCTAAEDPSELVDQVLAGRPDVMWCGTEEGVTAAALAGGADPESWPAPADADAVRSGVVAEEATGLAGVAR